ncbi:MAG: hypothetical protein PHI58_05005 [Candidatus Omnitrophica bacterium]|nr:hypothetical protein [Candidatus Omnitrophota bacterium]
MLSKVMQRVFIVALLLCANILCVDNLLAGIGVKPTVVEVEATPGVEKTGSLTVGHSEAETVVVKVEVEDWLKLRTGSSPISIKQWLIMDDTELVLEPAKAKNIGYRIRVPEGVKGELIAQIFFSGLIPSKGEMNITSRFGIALYVGIEGTEILDPVITDMQINGSALGVTIQNKGNVHIRPVGKVVIKNNDGTINQEVIVPYTAVIFSGRKHSYGVNIDTSRLIKGKKYTIEAEFSTGEIYKKSKDFTKIIDCEYK